MAKTRKDRSRLGNTLRMKKKRLKSVLVSSSRNEWSGGLWRSDG
jgi:hypothetical protein